jgi:hypothetical protein
MQTAVNCMSIYADVAQVARSQVRSVWYTVARPEIANQVPGRRILLSSLPVSEAFRHGFSNIRNLRDSNRNCFEFAAGRQRCGEVKARCGFTSVRS